MARLEAPRELDVPGADSELCYGPHSWPRNFAIISKNRSITQPIRLLQDSCCVNKEGTVGGPSWSDRVAPADLNQAEMDAPTVVDFQPK
jgi:hypothetical protein